MKKNTIFKILVAFVAAFVLGIALVACDGGNAGGNAGDESGAEQGEAAANDGADPLMDGEDAGKWNYNAQYVMGSVYGDAAQTDVALMLICEGGKFTVSSPKGIPSEIVPFSDEWGDLVNGADGIEGTYSWTYDGDVAKVTLELNGQTAEVTIEDDGFDQTFTISAGFFDPDDTTVYVDDVNDTTIKHSEQTIKFQKY